ncbi:MAG TPA: MCP four helix bundle domain-containing protein, partial [Dissulfurispiraceae bacterium]|nr:MCP four helix bundle domain-containing protein [Dissulfurispiraceae bacterium]
MNLGKLNISTRLGIGLGLIIAFMVVLTGTGIWSLTGINNKLEQITNVNNAKIDLAYTILASVTSIDKSLLIIFMANDENATKEEKKKIENGRATYQASMEKLEKLEKTAKGKELIEGIKSNFTIAQSANDQALEKASAGNMASAGSMLAGTLQISGMLG